LMKDVGLEPVCKLWHFWFPEKYLWWVYYFSFSGQEKLIFWKLYIFVCVYYYDFVFLEPLSCSSFENPAMEFLGKLVTDSDFVF
jgi:hypothetical protein